MSEMPEGMRKYMAEIGAKGGSATSDKKKRAMRENLKKANAARLRRRKMAKP